MSGAKEIDGIDVVIKRKPPKGAALTRQTDQQGRFTFSNLPAGDYGISFPPPSSTTNPVAKSFFRVSLQRAAGSDCAKKSGSQPPLIATGPLASIAVVANSASNARMAPTPGK
jgi:hypothetical protein